MYRNDFKLTDSEAKHLFEIAMDNSLVGVVITDKDGKYVYCNDIYESVTGLAPEKVLNMDMYDLARRTEGGFSSSKIAMETKEELFAVQRVLISGKKHLTKAFPILDNNGDIKYVVNTIIDVSQLSDIQPDVAVTTTDDSSKGYDLSKIIEAFNDNEDRDIIYASQKMGQMMDMIRIIAPTDATVLITGESGVGKELVAKEIHKNSTRNNKPYLMINCSAIPESLLESELFGYEAGTFTGGNPKGKKGLIEEANGGTLFLDEIGDMPLPLQVKLLRPLQEKEITRLGGDGKPIKVDVRFIAATNADLKKKVEEKTFREDLFYRLNVTPIEVPALRDRIEDIPLLAQYFVDKYNSTNGQNKELSNAAFQYLKDRTFPGNVRQLKNLIERACILSLRKKISASFLADLYDDKEYAAISNLVYRNGMNESKDESEEDMSYNDYLDEFEEMLFKKYGEKYNSTYKIAKALGLSQPTVSRKLAKYKIELKKAK